MGCERLRDQFFTASFSGNPGSSGNALNRHLDMIIDELLKEMKMSRYKLRLKAAKARK